MKTLNRKIPYLALLGIALSLTLVSFSPGKGGDSFKIYLNNSLVLEDYVYGNKGVKNISLKQANANDQLDITYSHCGKIGHSRRIVVKDNFDKEIKKWDFANADAKNERMSCKVKDILDLKKNSKGVLKLVYSSKELNNGQLLALII
jgi:hypothetical protein